MKDKVIKHRDNNYYLIDEIDGLELYESCIYGDEEYCIVVKDDKVIGYCYNGLQDVIDYPETELIEAVVTDYKLLINN